VHKKHIDDSALEAVCLFSGYRRQAAAIARGANAATRRGAEAMQALVCTQPRELTLAERPVPTAAPGAALVKIRRVGICGTDYHIYEGSHPYLEYPRVMGHELAVEVLAAPPESAVRPGELAIVNPYIACGTCLACRKGRPNCCMRISVLGVHGDGGMAEYLTLPAANLYPAGDLSAEAAATVEFLAFGAHGVSRAGDVAGARALVIGAGPIGIGAALFAALAGAHVTLMDRDVARLAEAARVTGIAAHIVADSGAAAAVARATDGDGFEVVIDATGNRASIEAGFGYVAHTGRYVLLSVVRENVTFADPEFHKREMTLFASRNAVKADFDRVVAAIRVGSVPVDRLITHRTTLAGAVADLPRWAHSKDGLVKAVIEVA
jgi:2-desacetyl-2-hydroxyethyl bacteriochlorophyllide A dehydrogenase